ncbi:hypothetical protein GYMLUDRAFT_48733 [Collybiopsis luxurians FD-317 M1]|uniref:Thioredoxin domain-containing protein n=1 Tax=Collybiopsis luxurians FD-317 M1 TaxID=944289 RepID=A0A0D0CHF7_9AGAR|nr:hypothetical protein GYMLUDRAFT_48733 [Collybiopsis luxurians FD-317 M1]
MTTLKLWQHLRNLPLILSLSLLCSALPVHSTELTPDNFSDSISDGVWFIEHFSPYCGHCRAFAPTWEELVQKNSEGGEDPTGIKLAQVNCAVHGDLCNANGVKGYPQMNIYKDGEFVETFKGARELPRLTEFLKRHAPVTPTEEPEDEETELETPGTNPNPTGSVIVLDDSNFDNVLSEGPAFVKFYAPWCGHCKKLAPTWKNLAKSMQYKLTVAEVDCEAHKALCKTNGIEGFPTLHYFAEGSKTEYSGSRKLERLREFAEKASEGGVKPTQADDLEKDVFEESLVYALLYPSSDRKLVSVLKPLFAPLLGSPAVYTVSDPPSSLTSRLSLPPSSWAIVSFKDHDFATPSAIYTSQTPSSQLRHQSASLDEIKSWLSLHRLPTTSELTQDSFQSIMNSPARPLVVLAAVSSGTKDKVQARMEELGQKWRARTGGSGMLTKGSKERPVVFAWMDVERWKDWMSSMYGIKSKGSASTELEDIDVVIADHKALLYYKTDASGSPIKLSTSSSVFSTLEGIAQDSIEAQNSENFIERVARYLNSKLQTLESYIINHPMHIVFLVIVGFVLVIMAARKALADDPIDGPGGGSAKNGKGRLD